MLCCTSVPMYFCPNRCHTAATNESSRTCSPHSSPSRQCARASSTGTPCRITAAGRPACGGASSPRDRILGCRFRGDRRRVFDEGSIRGPRFGIVVSTATMPCCSSPQGRLLTKTSSRHRLSLVGFVQSQQPLYAVLVSVRPIQETVRSILEIPFSVSVCFALRKESGMGACTQFSVSTSVSRTKVIYGLYTSEKSTQNAFIFIP